MLYRSECWTVNETDAQEIDTVSVWSVSLLRILSIRWHDFVRNADILYTNLRFSALSKLGVFHCLGMWLVWIGRQMQTKYSLNPLTYPRVLQEIPWVTALNLGKEYRRQSYLFCMWLYEARYSFFSGDCWPLMLCTHSDAC